MREFNLEEAKAGKPVCTRDGRKARIVCFDAKGDEYTILALVDFKTREEEFWYNADGKDTYDEESEYDLMMAGEPHEGWVNICSSVPIYDRGCSLIYNSREEANMHKGNNYITTIKIEWEE